MGKRAFVSSRLFFFRHEHSIGFAMSCIYNTLKDFAGPAATVFAAGAALVVTAFFNRRQSAIASAQKDIAAAQRDIAADRLKIDLFEKRYEIYIAARSLLTCALNYAHQKLPADEIVRIKIKLDESRFFFPSDIQALAQRIETMSEDIMFRVDERSHISPDAANWGAKGDELAKRAGYAHRLYAELPLLFQRDLRSDLFAGDPPKSS